MSRDVEVQNGEVRRQRQIGIRDSSCSSSLSELLRLALQSALVAFRVGLCALDTRGRLETSAEDRRRPWSVVVSGLEAEAAEAGIEKFCQDNASRT